MWQQLRRRLQVRAIDRAAAHRADPCDATTAIARVTDRAVVTVKGHLLSVTFPPENAATVFRGTLADPTGTAEIEWLGRTEIPGVHVGQMLVVHGPVSVSKNRRLFTNPSYRIVVPDTH